MSATPRTDAAIKAPGVQINNLAECSRQLEKETKSRPSEFVSLDELRKDHARFVWLCDYVSAMPRNVYYQPARDIWGVTEWRLHIDAAMQAKGTP